MATLEIQNQKIASSRSLVQRFIDVRSKTEELCLPLSAEDHMLSVTEDTSPPKWHLAHTTWFFEHFLLSKFKTGFEEYNPEYGFIFNSYYKTIGNYLPKNKRSVLSRPSLVEVLQYRHAITAAVIEIAENDIQNYQELISIIELGINHEQQHQELLLMDIKRNFFENPLKPHYQMGEILQGEIEEASWIKFHGGMVLTGYPKDNASFAFDNEKDQHQVCMESFELSSHLVTNEDYINFIEDGGYQNPSLWLSDGWDIIKKEKWAHPLYWKKIGSDWWSMTLYGQAPLELSAPVAHVSYYEASAFAKWKNCRLPSEEEWEVAAKLENVHGEFLGQGGLEPNPSSENHDVFSQIHGTVWEWTHSSYQAYPGYKPTGYGMNEYNEKFMCNQFVMRGGSCVTPESHYRITYRNFFYPHQRWMYGGIRLAKDPT